MELRTRNTPPERMLRAACAELAEVVMEALSRSTVMPGSAAHNHVPVEALRRTLAQIDAPAALSGEPGGVAGRVRLVTRALGRAAAAGWDQPSAAVPAVVACGDETCELRRQVAADLRRRLELAVGPDDSPDVVQALLLAISGALLVGSYGLGMAALNDRLDLAVDFIVPGRS
jgi:hypothetical protein